MFDQIRFSRFLTLTEAIQVKDGILDFSADSGISSKFGKTKALKPYTSKIPGLDMKVWSLYSAGKTENSTQILRAVKSADFESKEVRAFIIRSAVYAARLVRDLSPDIIVSPKSSSDLVKKLCEALSQRLYVPIYVDSFTKRLDISKVRVDTSNPKLTPKLIDSLNATIQRGVKKGYLSVTMFKSEHRPFITNLFEVVDEKLLSKFQGKKVLIVDDIMTSGTTAANIYSILKANGAEDVSCITMFKS